VGDIGACALESEVTIEEQRRIVTYLDGLQSKVDPLQKVESETGMNGR
jgi:hypothetical protein